MSLDRALVPTFRRQFGVIHRLQAHAAGATDHDIEYRLRIGRWEWLLRGVYRLAGVPPSWRQSLMAGCLWAGPGSAVSHRAAARLWGLDGIKEEIAEISHPRKLRPPASWLLVHRPAALPKEEVDVVGDIPLTVVSRTLLDLGAEVTRPRVEMALDGALRDRMVTLSDLRAVLERHGARGRDGTAALRFLLTERDAGYVPPASPLERLFFPVLADPRLPPAVRQHPIVEGDKIIYRLDFAYPAWGVAIEIDSYKHHFGRHSWESDRSRSNKVVALGWRMLHFTRGDADRPELVVQTVLAALREAGYSF